MFFLNPVTYTHTHTYGLHDGKIFFLSFNRFAQGPDGYPRHVDVEKKEPNLYKVKYTPDDCGRYTIDALYDGKQLPQSPIYVQSLSTGNVSTIH